MSKNQSTVFLLSWDMTGLETCINLSDIEKQIVWAKLTDTAPENPNQLIQAVLLRARYNSQRHYEVYTVHVTPDITESDLREMFETNPQATADLIRERGNKIYSDRIKQTEVKIV